MYTYCSPDVEFDNGMNQEDFDHETYDELVEDLEVAKMVVQNGGFDKIWTWLGNACVNLFNFQVGGVEEIIKWYGELKFKPKRNDEYDENIEDDFSLGEHPNKQQVKYKMTKRGSLTKLAKDKDNFLRASATLHSPTFLGGKLPCKC
ncbi:hypothetical protein SELMODRAFT_409335 [Selaginella moellendorffii]|uniref:Uncharacterized protein n=1 Tax=Selaginella moellendorffii TaxID=88036 RepID=D8RB46_SELML|nr:hypothetical protein SELMODRAFT_409335 [Selaginella moellendorffii]